MTAHNIDRAGEGVRLILGRRGNDPRNEPRIGTILEGLLDPHGPRSRAVLAELLVLPDGPTCDEGDAVHRMISEGCPNCGEEP